jgi:hypothetical protein
VYCLLLPVVFGTDAMTEVATSGRYHVWRLTYTIEAPTMLEAAEGVIRMARQARDAAGIHPEQAVGFSSQLRDLSHPHELVFPMGQTRPRSGVERGSASDPGADSEQ